VPLSTTLYYAYGRGKPREGVWQIARHRIVEKEREFLAHFLKLENIVKNVLYLIMSIVKHNPNMALAIELYASDPMITLKEMSIQCGVDKKTIQRWMRNPDFLDNLYKRYMEVAGVELPGVIQATIEEAKRGNVQAARLVLEHFGKLENRIKIQVESNFEKFMKVDSNDVEFTEIDDEDSEMFDKVADHLIDKKIELPERDNSNDFPRKREKSEKNRLEMARYSQIKKDKEAKTQHNAYEIRKRAKKVGLDLLPSGRHSKSARDEWMKKLIELENE
tara:strand:+ start:990 stop:1817 length:828 start_codon:yes stop_codon:yes gene_type:complete